MFNNIKNGFDDYKKSICSKDLWLLLGWSEIKQRYARSKIGPFWLTISMAVMIIALGFIYGSIFKASIKDYLPLLAIGLVFWGFISNVINEGCVTYINASSYLKQVKLPRCLFIFQNIWRNLIILAHNFLIVIIVLFIFDIEFIANIHYFILGMILVLVNLFWISTALALICARFRDLPQIVASIIQVVFYITPILFQKEMLNKFPLIIEINPFAHLIEVVRAPLISGAPNYSSWIFCVVMAILGNIFALLLHGKYKSRIPYWV